MAPPGRGGRCCARGQPRRPRHRHGVRQERRLRDARADARSRRAREHPTVAARPSCTSPRPRRWRTTSCAHSQGLGLPWLRAATYDGDTPSDERTWVRQHANYVLTNPDLLHHSLLPGHASWASVPAPPRPHRDRRGPLVPRRARLARVRGRPPAASPLRALRLRARSSFTASATMANPAEATERLIGSPAIAVTDDASPRPGMTVAFWEPPLLQAPPDGREPVRRSTLAETADLLADCVVEGRQSLAFIRSRRGAEATALMARDLLIDVDPALADGGGGLPRRLPARGAARARGPAARRPPARAGDDQRARDGHRRQRARRRDHGRLARAPGRACGSSSAGPAGPAARRSASSSPATIRWTPTSSTTRAWCSIAMSRRASSIPATATCWHRTCARRPPRCRSPRTACSTWFGPTARSVVDDLVEQGMLRRRPGGWFWTRRERATDLTDLRGSGGAPVRVVEDGTGRLLGTVDRAAAPGVVHRGAVYVHQGVTHVVTALDLDDAVATVVEQDVDYSTLSRSISDIRIVETHRVAPVRRPAPRDRRCHLPGGVVPATPAQRREPRRGAARHAGAGAAHAQRVVDAPGVGRARRGHRRAPTSPVPRTPPSTPPSGCCRCSRPATAGTSAGCRPRCHPDTGQPTVFVYDGYPGGAGFTEHGFRDRRRTWLARDARGDRTPAAARAAARRACSRPSAATATTRSTRTWPWSCSTPPSPLWRARPRRRPDLGDAAPEEREQAAHDRGRGGAHLDDHVGAVARARRGRHPVRRARSAPPRRRDRPMAWAPATAATSATVAARWRVTASDPTAAATRPTSRSTFTSARDHTVAAPRVAPRSRPLPRDRDALAQRHADAAQDRHRRRRPPGPRRPRRTSPRPTTSIVAPGAASCAAATAAGTATPRATSRATCRAASPSAMRRRGQRDAPGEGDRHGRQQRDGERRLQQDHPAVGRTRRHAMRRRRTRDGAANRPITSAGPCCRPAHRQPNIEPKALLSTRPDEVADLRAGQQLDEHPAESGRGNRAHRVLGRRQPVLLLDESCDELAHVCPPLLPPERLCRLSAPTVMPSCRTRSCRSARGRQVRQSRWGRRHVDAQAVDGCARCRSRAPSVMREEAAGRARPRPARRPVSRKAGRKQAASGATARTPAERAATSTALLPVPAHVLRDAGQHRRHRGAGLRRADDRGRDRLAVPRRPTPSRHAVVGSAPRSIAATTGRIALGTWVHRSPRPPPRARSASARPRRGSPPSGRPGAGPAARAPRAVRESVRDSSRRAARGITTTHPTPSSTPVSPPTTAHTPQPATAAASRTGMPASPRAGRALAARDRQQPARAVGRVAAWPAARRRHAISTAHTRITAAARPGPRCVRSRGSRPR